MARRSLKMDDGVHKERAHHVLQHKPKSQSCSQVIDHLRETYSGRSSLREAWLIWSHRGSRLDLERLHDQLTTMGFNIETETSHQLMEDFGDIAEGQRFLLYEGFLRLVTEP